MPLLIALSLMGVAGLSVLLTMKEAGVERISPLIVVKVEGLALLFCVMLGVSYELLSWLAK